MTKMHIKFFFSIPMRPGAMNALNFSKLQFKKKKKKGIRRPCCITVQKRKQENVN